MRGATRAVVGIAGAAATVLLHSLLLAVVMWGGGAILRPTDRSSAVGAGANSGTSEGQSRERRMTVRLLSDVEQLSPTATDAYFEGNTREALKLEITGPDALSLPPLVFEGEGQAVESSDAELLARTALTGVYESQIRARIERAWVLPAGFSSAEVFSCLALVRQHRDGRVSEVELPYESCEGTPTIRKSLVDAIFAASPLPAPPHAGVFAESFSLLFRSESVRHHR